MNDATEILTTARDRAQQEGLPYAGAVTPAEAFFLVTSRPGVLIIDVRTNAERDWIGRVAIPEERHHWIQWNLYPGGTRNPEFMAQLSAVASPDQPVLFLCRSGVRSRHAAALAAQHGYDSAFDILEGFEGDKDAQGHRKTVNGWCHAGLPWIGA